MYRATLRNIFPCTLSCNYASPKVFAFFFFKESAPPRALPSSPTRRSPDPPPLRMATVHARGRRHILPVPDRGGSARDRGGDPDRRCALGSCARSGGHAPHAGAGRAPPKIGRAHV